MKLRVVLVHNSYRSANPSGENKVVDEDLVELSEDSRIDVVPFFRDSDEIEGWGALRKSSLLYRPTYSPPDARAMRELLAEFRPDVVHLHNPYPLISPWIVRLAKKAGATVLQTVHNYRHECVNGIHFRDGGPCTDCRPGHIAWPALRHACYQESRLATAPMVAAQRVHLSTWRLVDKFLAVGPGVAEQLRTLGIPDARILLRPNRVVDPGPPAEIGSGVLYVGRLSEEKGIRLLLEAWGESGLGEETTLRIAGAGPLLSLVQSAAQKDASIQHLGYLDQPGLDTAYKTSALVVAPSLCFEAHPLSVVNALAHGRAVVAVDTAVARDIVGGAGWLSPPSASALASTLRTATADRDELVRLGGNARSRFIRTAPSRSTGGLHDVYNTAVLVGQGGLGASA